MPAPDRRVRLPNGLEIRIDKPDLASFYQEQVLEYFRHGLDVRPGARVVDVGANNGLFAIEALRRSGGTARLACIEPAPRSHRILEENLRALFPQAPVAVFRCALAARPGRATLYYRPGMPVVSSLYADRVDELRDPERWVRVVRDRSLPRAYRSHVPWWARLVPTALLRRWVSREIAGLLDRVVETPVEVRTLSGVLDEAGMDAVDLLKVDVEGAELEVLRGLEERHWAGLRAAVVEVHDVDGRGEEIAGLLSRHGLRRQTREQDAVHRGTAVHVLWAARD